MWPCSMKPVSYSIGTPYCIISSAMWRMAWNLSVFSPMPACRLPIFFTKYIMYLFFWTSARTCLVFILGLFSHCSHSNRVSQSKIQSSKTPFLLKSVGFVFVVIFLALRMLRPAVDRKTADIFSKIPRYSLAVSLPPLMPFPNLVLGKSRSL